MREKIPPLCLPQVKGFTALRVPRKGSAKEVPHGGCAIASPQRLVVRRRNRPGYLRRRHGRGRAPARKNLRSPPTPLAPRFAISLSQIGSA
jgi:hypothetical protein